MCGASGCRTGELGPQSRAGPDGQALVDAVTKAAAPAGGISSDAKVTDSGAQLHIEFQASASDGGGLSSSEESRVLCVDLFPSPKTDPATSVEDADCQEPIPRGYRITTLD